MSTVLTPRFFNLSNGVTTSVLSEGPLDRGFEHKISQCDITEVPNYYKYKTEMLINYKTY